MARFKGRATVCSEENSHFTKKVNKNAKCTDGNVCCLGVVYRFVNLNQILLTSFCFYCIENFTEI